MAKTISESAYYKTVMRELKGLKLYRPEFKYAVKRYAGMRREYDILREKYANNGFETGVETASGGEKTSPLIVRMNQLEQNMLKLEDGLGLNPRSFQTMELTQADEQDDKLKEILEKIS